MTKKKKLKSSKEKNPPSKIRADILALLTDPRSRGLNFQQLIKRMGLKKKDDIKRAGFMLDQLEEEGVVRQLDNARFVAGAGENVPRGEELTGILDHVSSRFAYVKVGEDRGDIYVKGRDIGSAVDGDTVKVVVFPTKHGDHQEGKVTEVISRNRTRYVGKIEVSKGYAFVVPERPLLPDFYRHPPRPLLQ